MKFSTLKSCLDYLDRQRELKIIDIPVDPDLEMAEITRQVFDAKGPALLFTNVKGSRFPAVSNLMGTWKRVQTIFEPQLSRVSALVDLASDSRSAFKKPSSLFPAGMAAVNALPLKVSGRGQMDQTCRISDLPMIRCWPLEGGGFILLPQVFSMDPDAKSILKSNLGMYRIQMSGNEYVQDQEIGLHYQIHRGIAIHHKKALEKNKPLKVSIFIGGPPAHTLAAVMPLPEGMAEVMFAGALAGRNFRYTVKNGYVISTDADFCITGTIVPGQTKREGPFGDHLGYYSMDHDYPFLRVDKVYHRKDAVFPFTVVGRPPQEDSNFGRLIHEITRSAIRDTIPGVTAVNAVDDAGVHPLLLAKANERYIPYQERQPMEILTHASRILGTNQLSLAKYLLIAAHEDCPELDINNEEAFFRHLLERIDFSRDLHFVTRTTMDTLDYSSGRLNHGSKLIMACAGKKRRTLCTSLPPDFSLPTGFSNPNLAARGIAVVNGPSFTAYEEAQKQMQQLVNHLEPCQERLLQLPMIAVTDDSQFAASTFANFLWVTFLKSNPSHDIYGVGDQMEFKHWGCKGPLIVDARTKPFHSKVLEPNKSVVEKVKGYGARGKPLHGII